MKKIWIAAAMTLALAGCSNKKALDIPTGTDVTVEKTDGVTVAGRLVEVQPDQVIVESRDGIKTHVQRSQIASMRQSAAVVERDAAKPSATAPTPTAAAAPSAAPAEGTNPSAPAASAAATKPAETPADAPAEESRVAAAKPVERKPEYREVTLPSGTALTVELATTVGSDTSQIEDPVRGRLRNAVRVDGVEALPVGTAVLGHVTSVAPAGKVKGVASIAFRFSTLDLPGEGGPAEREHGDVLARVEDDQAEGCHQDWCRRRSRRGDWRHHRWRQRRGERGRDRRRRRHRGRPLDERRRGPHPGGDTGHD